MCWPSLFWFNYQPMLLYHYIDSRSTKIFSADEIVLSHFISFQKSVHGAHNNFNSSDFIYTIVVFWIFRNQTLNMHCILCVCVCVCVLSVQCTYLSTDFMSSDLQSKENETLSKCAFQRNVRITPEADVREHKTFKTENRFFFSIKRWAC